MKILGILFVSFMLQAPLFASAEATLPDGGYQGRMVGSEKGKVHLLIQANAGCDGCFTAIAVDTPDLNSRTVRMVAYTGMPWDSTHRSFSLTPINQDTEGELTHPNDDPSLMLNLTSAPNEPVTFNVVPSGSGNLMGFTSSMDFSRSKESPFELVAPTSGEYRYFHKRKTNAVISSIVKNGQDEASEVSMQWFGGVRHAGGAFNLKEKFPAVYSLNSVVFSATGRTINDRPNYIVVFARKNSKNYILMVNPVDSRDVLCLTSK